MRKAASVACLSLLLAGSALGTPNAHTWHREILLGSNGKEFTYLLWRHVNPGSDFTANESLYIYQRSNVDARWAQRSLLRTTMRSMDPGTGGQSKVETFVADTSVSRFLVNYDCQPAFFESWPDSIAIDERGMYYHDKGRRAYFLSAKEMQPWLDADFFRLDAKGQDLRVTGRMRTAAPQDSATGRIDYFLVRAGRGMDDAGQYEGIIPVPASSVTRAISEVRQRLAPPKRPQAVKR